MKNQDNSSIDAGSNQTTHPSTPGSTRVGKSTLKSVEFTDDLGVVYRISFDPSGWVNLTHLADVVRRDVESFLASHDVGVLRQHLQQAMGDKALIIFPRIATRSKSGRRLRISARAPRREWWVDPAIAAYFLEYVDAPVLHAWFQWQCAARGWSRPKGWDSEFGFLPSCKETEIKDSRAALLESLGTTDIAARPRSFTPGALPAAKTQLENFIGMSPAASATVECQKRTANIEREAAALLALLEDSEDETLPPGSPSHDLRPGKQSPERGRFVRR